MRTRSELRSVQQRLIEEMKTSEGVLIVLGMGGGKTVSALTAVRDLQEARTIRAAIVIAPKRVALTVWPAEVRKWEHLQHMRIGVMAGTPAQRAKILREAHDVYVCGIDNLTWLIDELKELPAHAGLDQLIIDEMSRFKSPRGTRAKALNRFSDAFGGVWGLTGTPRPNSWDDVWMPLQIVSKGRAWGLTFDPWRMRYFTPLDYHQRTWAVREDALPYLRNTMNTWAVTIPPEETVDVPFVSGPDYDILVPLSLGARADADSMARELMVELGREGTLADLGADGGDIVALSQAVASGKLSQIMQGYIYRDGQAVQRYDENKSDALVDFVAALDGEPLIICYWYQEDLAMLRELYPSIRHLGASMSDKAFAQTCSDWNEGKIPLLALHPASAGHGLELQFGGARMLFYSMPWSPELYIQTIKRIARSGQTRPVFVHHMLADHAYERLRMERVLGKIEDEADFINDIGRI
jgi:hypothetical protein